MEILKFKTNIKCNGCVATVTPVLNDEKSMQSWQADINSPDKILTVTGAEVDPQTVKNLVQEAGFTAEFLQVAGTSGSDL